MIYEIIILAILYALYQVLKFLGLYAILRHYRITGIRALNWLSQWIFGQNKAPFPVHWTSQIIDGGRISISDDDPDILRSFAHSGNCYYQAKNCIFIGGGTIWGPGCKFISANHRQRPHKGHEPGPGLIIGRNCWIGAGVILLPGVSLGTGCIVGAGSVVTKGIYPPGSKIVGNPARMHESLAAVRGTSE